MIFVRMRLRKLILGELRVRPSFGVVNGPQIPPDERVSDLGHRHVEVFVDPPLVLDLLEDVAPVELLPVSREVRPLRLAPQELLIFSPPLHHVRTKVLILVQNRKELRIFEILPSLRLLRAENSAVFGF